MTTWSRMVQFYDTVAAQGLAAEILSGLRVQADYVAGRIIPPSPAKPGWHVQVLFEDCGHDLPLCDGMRRVIVPPSLLATMRS